MAKTTKPKEKAVLLRLSPELHRELVHRAKAEHRSTVAHLRHLIQEDLKESA